MNSKGIKPLSQDICMCCLKNKATHKYYISGRGYGSGFDNENTHWQCCDDCHKDEYDLWANEVPNNDEEDCYFENYTYEDNIYNLIDSLPLESRELFYNTFSSDSCLDAQDWIDYKLNELPHEKCKEYGLYSYEEIKAYKQRFPNCAEVYKKVYNDGSSCCRCKMSAHGNSDGTCDEYNISSECYMCTSYSPRESEMKIINELDEYYKDEKSRLEDMLKYATTRLKELEENRQEYFNKHEYDY